jgi:hypothetical protein
MYWTTTCDCAGAAKAISAKTIQIQATREALTPNRFIESPSNLSAVRIT